MEEKRDNIYIYLWENLNTIYVGRTVNPKSRHYQHRHIPTEKTYQFSSEHGVEHPKMIIIENDLTIEEGIEREKYWIEYYRSCSKYCVLNKTCGGQIGNKKVKIILTEEEKIKHRKEYYQKNKDRILNYAKTYKRKVSEKTKETRKKYYERNKEKILNERKKYREKNRGKILEQKRKYREENREKILEQKRKYREKHREELLAKQKEYNKKHREERLEYDRKYRKKLKKNS